MSSVPEQDELRLATSYSVCRTIARRAAKNFYYGFMLLPGAKRDALCAVYAFMRHADDLADDPGLKPAERHQKLTAFLDSYRRAFEKAATDDPVFLALADAQRRYRIPMELLEKLVAGTEMDVVDEEPKPGELLIGYETFDELYDYCYHVASVVGLVCIRIFGYRDRAAEKLAEQLGVAFQLTNILRDIKEDAAMQRIYLPLEDLDRFGVREHELAQGEPREKVRPLLEFEAQRARELYRSIDQLLPLIDEVSQPALWAMTEIYRGILDRIEQRQGDVYRERVRLKNWEKVLILLRGFGRRFV